MDPEIYCINKNLFPAAGFHVQFNVVDSKMLKDAQAHPENYRDLVVRVAGFSAYWVEMSKALQDQVIERTEHNCKVAEGTIFDIQHYAVHDGPGIRTLVS